MRRVRYHVASSLDGYILGPNGEMDWIVVDPEMDFNAMFSAFDTALIGRKTYETMLKAGRSEMPGIKIVVFSRTLKQKDHPGVTIVADNAPKAVAELQSAPGKDIWLFGGGELFTSLADEGLVNTVELALMPAVLGGGLPLAPKLKKGLKLKLSNHKIYEATGIVSLEYRVQ
jgi:dihydrofolate reductase